MAARLSPADHLWQRGYRRAACLDVATSDEVRERLVGFQLRCEQLGMPCHWIDRPADDALVDRSELLRQVLASDSRPCGIYCHHDRTAAFCRDDVLAWGWSIPDRVGIIGTGDIPAVCFSQAPELSSVPLPWYAMGRQAVLQLQRQLNGSAIKDLPLLRPAVVECRASTALAEQPDRLASKALNLVRRHLHRSWSVEELADRLGCSPPTLRRHILRSTGMGLHAWRQRERIDRAKSLLMRGDLSLQQVAERCGFTSRRSFHRVFREQAGLAPGAYRTEQGM